MRLVLGPAFFHQIRNDVLSITNNVIASLIVLEVVVASLPCHVDEFACRAHGRGAVHPTQHDIRLVIGDFPPELPRCSPIQLAAELQLYGFNPTVTQRLRAFGIGSDNHSLVEPGAR